MSRESILKEFKELADKGRLPHFVVFVPLGDDEMPDGAHIVCDEWVPSSMQMALALAMMIATHALATDRSDDPEGALKAMYLAARSLVRAKGTESGSTTRIVDP